MIGLLEEVAIGTSKPPKLHFMVSIFDHSILIKCYLMNTYAFIYLS